MGTPAGPRVVALIPARAGSRRVPDKNVRPLGGHPLLAYTIAAAAQSEVFADIVVSTDSSAYAEVARHYGAEVPGLRPAELARERSPDIDWVADLLTRWQRQGRTYDAFSLLRPTSPFRQPQTIRRAWAAFRERSDADALRAIEPCRQHPGKMWLLEDGWLTPLLSEGAEPPWHSRPYQDLPPVYEQNGSLEIAWCRLVFETRSIAGRRILPFLTEGYEGFDINTPQDWLLADTLVRQGLAQLPRVDVPAPALAA
jgi:N-acylneuraminate cytidylyltransferase